MGRMVKRLSGLEIDEVSLVDRPANQHGLVAIAKRQEDTVGIFDAQGNEVDEEQLEHGDVVYDDAGNEFVFVEGEEGAGDDGGPEEYDEDDEVGKADFSLKRAKQYGRLGRAYARKAGKHIDRNRGSYGLGAGAAAGSGATYAATSKSLGDQVLTELSKALNDSDRDQVIAKALNQVEEVAKRNNELEEMVAALIEERDAEGFTELAKSYELPVDPDAIGGLMQRAAYALPQEDVAALDRIFASYGEIAKGAFEEVGYTGVGEGSILEQVYAAAGDAVSKSGAALTQEQAVTALFEANPAAYDEYEAEQRRR